MTSIHIILDRSGSMWECMDDTIGGFNTFISDQRVDKSNECRISLYQFDHEYMEVYRDRKIEEVSNLSREDYCPRGQTALLDAIGRTIGGIKEEGKVVVVIITDGQDNMSKEFELGSIKKMIEKKKEDGWNFVFLGANQDAIVAGGNLGIGRDSSMTFSQTPQNVNSCFRNLSAAISRNRSGEDIVFTPKEREESIEN